MLYDWSERYFNVVLVEPKPRNSSSRSDLFYTFFPASQHVFSSAKLANEATWCVIAMHHHLVPSFDKICNTNTYQARVLNVDRTLPGTKWSEWQGLVLHSEPNCRDLTRGWANKLRKDDVGCGVGVRGGIRFHHLRGGNVGTCSNDSTLTFITHEDIGL